MQRAHSILRNFRIIFRSTLAHSRLVEKKTGVSATQLWMLAEILNAPGIKVTKLADLLSIHQSTCSNILDKLQKKDLIRRERKAADQRTVHLYLTEKGDQVLANSPRPAQGALVDVLQRLPEEVLIGLEVNLAKLVEALRVIEQDAAMKPLDLENNL